jgi:hypothetical protein
MSAVAKFVRELSQSPLHAQYAPDIAKALDAMDLDGAENPDAGAHFAALEWIMNQPDSIDTRLKAIARLFELPGKFELNMRQFYRPA